MDDFLFYSKGIIDGSRMHYIPFSVEQLREALLGLLNTGEKPPRDLINDWKEFLIKVDLFYAAQYHKEKHTLLDLYSNFDPSEGAAGRDGKIDWKRNEEQFLKCFRENLETANFRMITQEEVETATSHNFQSTIPIEAEWSKFVPLAAPVRGKGKGSASSDKGKEEVDEGGKSNEDDAGSGEDADFTDKLWLFHRGMGAEKFTGMLTMQKVDVYLEKLLGKCCGPRRKPGAVVVSVPPPIVEPQELKGRVQRISLLAQMARQGWKTLFRPTVVQEPTFKEVLLVYRVKSEDHQSQNDHALFIKVFRDIPQADLEVLYPCKTTRMAPLDLVKFIGVAVSGVLSMLLQRQTESGGYSAFAGFLGLLVTVLFNYQRQKTVYNQQTLGDIYRKTKDADKGAVNYIIEEVALQEVKEVILAFWFLSHSSKPRTPDDLDVEVESFLRELQTVFGSAECKIDFEVQDALNKLVSLKLATKENGHYAALPLSQATDALAAAWASVRKDGVPTRLSRPVLLY